MSILKSIKTRFTRGYEVLNLITVSQSAIIHNFDLIQSVHDIDVIPVLKANAYGHGLKEVAMILKARNPPFVAVDGYFEALAIRQVSKQPVLVMGSIGANNINSLRTKGVSFVVFSKEAFNTLKKSRRTITVHLEINTGMNRHGLSLDELADVLTELPAFPNVHVEGVMTHLSSTDEIQQDYSDAQFVQFETALQRIHQAGLHPKYIHATNSAGTAKKLPEYITSVRPGIALYGINTLEKQDPFYSQYTDLKPALTLTSHIDQIITAQPGDSIGYNRTYRVAKTSRIATIPIGYYEGIPRSLSNKSFITAGNTLLPTTGTICMNHTMFDCSETTVEVGDRVTLISSENDAPNSIVSLRDRHGLFEYSLPTGLRSTIRRRVVR